MKEILGKEIGLLKIDKESIDLLNTNNISTVQGLCNCSRMELVDFGLKNSQINKIIISMQLNGLDLKKNHARKNSILLK